MEIERPAAGIVLLTISGSDTGELGDAAFQAIEPDFADGRQIELFIDARETRAASMGVSEDWALWLRKHRTGLRQITMLTGSRLVQVTAEFVRRFNAMGDRMRITGDPGAFELALCLAARAAVGRAARRG